MNQLHQNIKHLRKLQPDWFLGIGEDPTISQLEVICQRSGYALENLMLSNLQASELPWKNIQFIFLDVDGVMTEGGMHYTEKGDEFKRFDTKDGMAIKKTLDAGIKIGIISSGFTQNVIKHRASMFGIEHVYVGREKKEVIAEQWLSELGFDWYQCGYIGDDINDRAMMQKVAISATPADGVQAIKDIASFTLKTKGGYGCVREFLNYLPDVNGKL